MMMIVKGNEGQMLLSHCKDGQRGKALVSSFRPTTPLGKSQNGNGAIYSDKKNQFAIENCL